MKLPGLLVSAFLVLSVAACAKNNQVGSDIGYTNVAEAFADLRKLHAEFREEEGWIIVLHLSDKAPTTYWSFTRADHPAHPTAVRRTVYPSDGCTTIQVDAFCEAETVQCDKLLSSLEALETTRPDQNACGGDT